MVTCILCCVNAVQSVTFFISYRFFSTAWY